MVAENHNDAGSQVRDVINKLQSPIPDLPALLVLVSSLLDCVGLLPPQYKQYNTAPLHPEAFNALRHLPPIQRALLEHVIPTWEPDLSREKLIPLVDQWFIPDAFSYASPAAGEVTAHAYGSILSLSLTPYSTNLLARLTKAYPLDRLHASVFSHLNRDSSPGQTTLAWEDVVKSILSVPARVANAFEGRGEIPKELEQGPYFANLCVRCEALLWKLSQESPKESMSSLTYLFTKLANVGAFPASKPTSPSQPSFFLSTLPVIRRRLSQGDTTTESYSSLWVTLLESLPSSFALQNILASLFAHITVPDTPLDTSSLSRGLVKREAGLLLGVAGRFGEDKKYLLECASAVVLTRDWSEGHARVYCCWAAGATTGVVDVRGEHLVVVMSVSSFSTPTLDTWTSSDHIKHSLLGRHHYLTLLLLITISYLPASSSTLRELALSVPFIRSISTYIGHLDPSVRRCGMLVAEEVARRTGKELDFKDWDGDDGGKPWTRSVRNLLCEKDADAEILGDDEGHEIAIEEIMEEDAFESASEPVQSSPPFRARPDGHDSDDSLTGYASLASSRSPSPTPSELAEIERDPTLRVGRTKISRPVYLAQLGEMIRGTSGLKTDQENQEADKLEVALDVSEELIRRKRGYGTELEENAVNLVYGLVGLHDNYELDGFDIKRQAALNALVACCPRKAAPAIVEEFFKNQYSTDQRYVMLNGLSLGALELAGLPLPAKAAVHPLAGDRVSFPSKRLPGTQHERYLLESSTTQVQGLLQDVARLAIENTREANADRTPDLVRERRLCIRQPAKVTEISQPSTAQLLEQIRMSRTQSAMTKFTDVAVESFLYPLINRFWLFLRDEQAREERTAHRDILHQYRGAGTGLILNALVLSHLLATLGVLVHASRNAPAWLAVVAPDALELAVTLGTRPISRGAEEEGESGGESGSGDDKDARVLTTALELALIVLDACVELDGGRSLSLEHTGLLLAAGEWAQGLFARLEKGILVKGGGGASEVRLRKAAAGVVIKVDEVSERWKRSMIDFTI
ncbi:telomere length regulation protein-domain-containing protein [Russula earlei]|uniref:Telomere length regulation protein-domain-containing protein n=1 Tax=Russula earlei TaxID=71964 RepID=A0ACC0UFN7_9AGAM|nr:telomere length regulation protein-domain-containing protein [Russula earlei]